MEIESAGSKVGAVEKVEQDRDVYVGEGGQLNAVRVDPGLAGKGKSSISKASRPSELSGTGEIGRGNASEMKA